jgi:hypothetical protein
MTSLAPSCTIQQQKTAVHFFHERLLEKATSTF